jgi:hypothetical protein
MINYNGDTLVTRVRSLYHTNRYPQTHGRQYAGMPACPVHMHIMWTGMVL